MDRRKFIACVGAASVTGLAGCSGSSEPDDSSSGDADESTPEPTEGSTSEPTTEPTPTETATPEPESALKINEDEFYEEDFSAGVTGIVENTTDETISYVAVEVAFYDADDVKLEDGLDNTQDLKGGGKWKFDAMYPGDASEVDHYEISASDSPF
ncbi:hypothetical protein SAMN04488063_1298 [Halopelagius inordinatus]|uniref:Uncharacterized protein n=1 Tax=Halopelagius inordinatus TaxID=553467 RepID=A0A1I2NXM3_9EURY|nr:FxLYD domain-containing protein [Halopelagius inordinatus]SFG06031.1 hypothetical protein SAMN04488063_1298 [Halopelagius inordinatus]